MNERLKKPRVFLSHSKADSNFIKRLNSDLRKCQIEPWLDEIFEGGLPICDCILVYLAENSLASSMAKEELDTFMGGNKLARPCR